MAEENDEALLSAGDGAATALAHEARSVSSSDNADVNDDDDSELS